MKHYLYQFIEVKLILACLEALNDFGPLQTELVALY